MTDRPAGRRVNRLDELALDLPPARDLWPAISQAIEAEKASAPHATPRRRTFWMPAAGMAAAVALVAIGVIIGRGFAPDTGARLASTAVTGNPDIRPAALRDANYRKQRDALLDEVNDRLQTMPAPEREKVAASLATLRRSISEIESALGRDPANALLQELLVSSCQEEMRALTAVRDAGGQET
jgi:hypothetical protein